MWGEEILRETIIYNKDIKTVDFKDKKLWLLSGMERTRGGEERGSKQDINELK